LSIALGSQPSALSLRGRKARLRWPPCPKRDREDHSPARQKEGDGSGRCLQPGLACLGAGTAGRPQGGESAHPELRALGSLCPQPRSGGPRSPGSLCESLGLGLRQSWLCSVLSPEGSLSPPLPPAGASSLAAGRPLAWSAISWALGELPRPADEAGP
jgi:hypothetical protein